MSQPAISKTLKELEEIVCTTLFERDRRGASLTADGTVFLPRAANALIELQAAFDSLSQRRTQAEMTVRIGALPTVGASFAPEAVRRFQAAQETALIQLVSGPNRHLLDRLRADALDVVVGRLAAPEQMTDLSFIHLYSEAVRFAVRPGHPLADDRPVDLRRLAEFTVLVPDRDALIRPAVDRLLITHGVATLENRIETVSNAFGRTFTRDGNAVWIISHGVIARDLEDGLLVALAVDTSDTSGAVGLTTRADAEPNAGTKLFMQVARSLAAERVADSERSANGSRH